MLLTVTSRQPAQAKEAHDFLLAFQANPRYGNIRFNLSLFLKFLFRLCLVCLFFFFPPLSTPSKYLIGSCLLSHPFLAHGQLPTLY